MACLADNRRMQQLALKFDAELTFDFGSVVGEVEAAHPTPLSMMRERMAAEVARQLKDELFEGLLSGRTQDEQVAREALGGVPASMRPGTPEYAAAGVAALEGEAAVKDTGEYLRISPERMAAPPSARS